MPTATAAPPAQIAARIAAHSKHREENEPFQCVCSKSGSLTWRDDKKLTPVHLKNLGFKSLSLVGFLCAHSTAVVEKALHEVLPLILRAFSDRFLIGFFR